MRNFLIRFWKHNPKPLDILNLYEGCPYRICPHVCIWLYLCVYFGEGNTHSSIPAWRIPRTEEPGGLQSMVWQESDMTEGLIRTCVHIWGFPGGTRGKKKKKKTRLPMQEMSETQVWSLGQEDPLEEGVVTHSRILAWRISWTEEPSGPQSIGLQRVRHDWSDLASMHVCI